MPTEYLTTAEAAEYLRLSRQFLQIARMRGDGSGPPFIKLARAVRYRRAALDAWMSAHDRAPGKPTAKAAR
ncbi:helix-turn-helix domain-containing protein [Bradyrhizobium sp.]|uniref:helix-turn-helix domain-containing protein n=1 Tax=Bradyrhizobium sp. TaxID=376 RepID=UPI003BB1BE80